MKGLQAISADRAGFGPTRAGQEVLRKREMPSVSGLVEGPLMRIAFLLSNLLLFKQSFAARITFSARSIDDMTYRRSGSPIDQFSGKANLAQTCKKIHIQTN